MAQRVVIIVLKEKVMGFIDRFNNFHSHISYFVHDVDIQCIFISNFKKDNR